MSLLALLDDGPDYGLALRDEFEERTGGVYPLNVGQVYTTLARLERDGYVRALETEGEAQKLYEITGAGRERLGEWFATATETKAPSRDELVLKLVMAATRGPKEATRVVRSERRSAVEALQRYTRLKREAPSDGDVGWLLLLDSLIFQTEARVRWLDACETRLSMMPPARPTPKRSEIPSEVRT